MCSALDPVVEVYDEFCAACVDISDRFQWEFMATTLELW